LLKIKSKIYWRTRCCPIEQRGLYLYLYDFELGMQVEQTIEIKKMASDFWDTMEDESRS